MFLKALSRRHVCDARGGKTLASVRTRHLDSLWALNLETGAAAVLTNVKQRALSTVVSTGLGLPRCQRVDAGRAVIDGPPRWPPSYRGAALVDALI